MGDPQPVGQSQNQSTGAKLWTAAKALYGWLGGHPTVAALIVGLLAGVVIGKAL